MSRSYRSYDEDWQRRKSILIRSLFHDIPILSPVPEESNDSSQYVATYDVFDERLRPYSPLPPLIIEREPKKPNKHDEPEEYYRKLHYKIKKIYIKLFIENRDLSNDDYNLTYNYSSDNDENFIENYESIDMNLDLNLPEDNLLGRGDIDSINDVRVSFNSINSNGYGADFESMDTQSIDVVNYTESNEDEVMRYEEEESSNKNIDEHESIEMDDSDSSTTDEQETSETKNSSYVRIDEQKKNESEESAEMRTYDQNKPKFKESKQVSIDTFNPRDEEESNNSTNHQSNNYGLTESEESRNDQETNDTEESNNVTETDLDSIVHEKELKSKKDNKTASDDEYLLTVSNVEVLEEDGETNLCSDGTDYRQITTKALVHVDGAKDTSDEDSRVYEDSVKSIILPARQIRRLTGGRNVDEEDKIEEISALEENEDPNTVTTFITDESEITGEDIEEMRTPHPDISQVTIPNTHHSDSGTQSDHIPLPQEATALTSSSQDGDKNISELKTSDDMVDILTSIFNESRNKEDTVPLGRKRKLCEDISVQTSERITWDDIKGNFFNLQTKPFDWLKQVSTIA